MKRRTSRDLDTLLGRRFTNALSDADQTKLNWQWIVLPYGTGDTIDMIQFVLTKHKRVMTGWRKVNNKIQYLILWKEKIEISNI